jgi:hypothetical protein
MKRAAGREKTSGRPTCDCLARWTGSIWNEPCSNSPRVIDRFLCCMTLQGYEHNEIAAQL